MLPAYNTVIFNGKDLNTLGFFSTGSGTYAAPERALDVVEVPGRSGDLVFDNGRFKNITVTYPGFIGENLETNFRNLKGFLLSGYGQYFRLEDTYHPDEFRYAYFKGPITPTVDQFIAASFNLDFVCKPMRYLKSGEIPVEFSADGNLENPSYMASKPIIRVYGSGQVNVGDWQINVTEHDQEYVDIDCELMDCHCGLVNLNSKVTFNKPGFPEIATGEHGVQLGTGVTNVTITPRWWVL